MTVFGRTQTGKKIRLAFVGMGVRVISMWGLIMVNKVMANEEKTD